MAIENKTVGNNLKLLRKKKGFTQEQIAAYLEIDQTTVSKMESGERSISVSTLEKLCDLFLCQLEDFVIEASSCASQKIVAFRANELDSKDLQALAQVGRIVRNLEEMTELKGA